MKPMLAGLACSAAMLVPVVVYVAVRIVQFRRDYAPVWGSYRYTIYRSGSYVDDGASYRSEDPRDLDYVARRLLTEWLDSPAGEKALLSDGHLMRYCCRVQYDGRVGSAWG